MPLVDKTAKFTAGVFDALYYIPLDRNMLRNLGKTQLNNIPRLSKLNQPEYMQNYVPGNLPKD